jgi:hypothetical protein
MRNLAIRGLVAVATVLTATVAIPAAGATASAPMAASQAIIKPVTSIRSALAPGALPGAFRSAHPVAYPAGAPGPTVSSRFDELWDVSCLGPGDCVAVGVRGDASLLSMPLAYQWNGHAWRATPVALPPDATQGYLTSVSCTPRACLAVGIYWDGATVEPLTTSWAGGRWRTPAAQPPLPVAGSQGFLRSVTCLSADDCVAGGVSNLPPDGATFRGLVETWNGHSWTALDVPAPDATGLGAVVQAVYCFTGTSCLFGGYWQRPDGTYGMLAVRWDGGRFSTLPLPDPTRAAGEIPIISGISCTSRSSCVVSGLVGSEQTGTAVRGFAEALRGTAWSLTPLPPTGGQPDPLYSVSCASPSFCAATGGVGSFATSQTGGKAAIATWNGSTWTRTVFTSPAGQGGSFVGVTCRPARSCIAVGTEGTFDSLTSAHGLTAFTHGRGWRLAGIAR